MDGQNLRYVDDFILLATNPQTLQVWQRQISNFVRDRLALAINQEAMRLEPVGGGVDFAGFIVRQHYRLVRRRVIGNLKEKLQCTRRKLVRCASDYVAFRFEQQTLDGCQAAVNSYLGHFKHAQTRTCVTKLWQKFPFLQRYFVLSYGKIIRIDKPLRHKFTLNKQVRWLHRHFKDYICLIEVGCYFEAFGLGAQRLAKTLDLTLHKDWRGFAFGCRFPRRFLAKMIAELKKQKVPVVVVRQTGRELHKAKERLPYLILEFAQEEHG